MKKTFKIICGAFLSLAFAGAASAMEEVSMEPVWLVQKASSPSVAPNPAAWRKGCNTLKDDKNVHSQYLKRDFVVPESWLDARLVLDFQRINGNAIVFVNGRKVGERLGPYGRIEITGFAKKGINELLVFNTRNYTGVSRTFETDPLRRTARRPENGHTVLGEEKWSLGIDAPVLLLKLPRPAAIADSWAETSVKNKKLTLHVELSAVKAVPGATLQAVICDAAGKEVLRFSRGLDLASGIVRATLEKEWASPRLWELEDGYCHTAKLALFDGAGRKLDSFQYEFGFREVTVENRTVLLNGHPARFRMEWHYFGLNPASITLLKLLGRNALYYQSNTSGWWRDWGAEVFFYDHAELAMLDHAGIAVLLPVPSCNFGGEAFLRDEAMRRDYRSECGEFIRRYRRHPSILAWNVSMNSFNPKDAIHPDTMGRRSDYKGIQPQVLKFAMDTVRENDATRLVYGHADGNIGDLASSNCYPNFAPVQEVEDWPERWSVSGDMPYMACEFAAIYDGSYFKGRAFYMTEYAAMLFGPAAYSMETKKQLERTIQIGLNNRGHGDNLPQVVDYAPLYWKMQKLYVEAIDRAWRTYGVQGWHYFNFHIGYGVPEKYRLSSAFGRYNFLKTPLASRPEWANPQFDYYAKNMQPLLTYWGGAAHHTDKTHSFRSGERIEKSLVCVWDGPGEEELSLVWTLRDPAGRAAASGTKSIRLANGDICFEKIGFDAPEAAAKTVYRLEVDITRRDGRKSPCDAFRLEVFPKRVPTAAGRFYLYDPKGLSDWVRTIAPETIIFTPESKLVSGDVLIVGREALKIGGELPVGAATLGKGVKVLVLEQLPDVWEALGFRNRETASRNVYGGSRAPELLAGLSDADLAYWRGKATLLPEFKNFRAADVTLAPHTSNRNIVASTVMEIPAKVGFLPLLVCEFDLGFSPLLYFRDGAAEMFFSSLDFTGRVPSDPAATLLAANLLRTVASGMAKPEKRVVFAATADELAKAGCRTAKKSGQLFAPPPGSLAEGIPVNFLRSRAPIDYPAVVSAPDGWSLSRDGAFLESPDTVYCQIVPACFDGMFRRNPDKAAAIQISILRTIQMNALLSTLCGGSPEAGTLERLTHVRRGEAFRNLEGWTVLGPFHTGATSAEKALSRSYPGEKQALAGDLNPNLTFKNSAGKTLDFRTTVSSDASGLIDLSGLPGSADGVNPLGYAVKEIDSPVERMAMLRFGADYFFALYCNGKLVYEQSTGHGAPKANAFNIRLSLKKGRNVLVVKLLGGSKGFGFWANLAEAQSGTEDSAALKVDFYNRDVKFRDPYEYFYW